jgi:hypothetical protein
MATILVTGSFLAGALISLLIPIGLLIAIGLWHTLAIIRVPRDPAHRAAQAAGLQESEGLGVLPQDAPES